MQIFRPIIMIQFFVQFKTANIDILVFMLITILMGIDRKFLIQTQQ